MEEENIIRILRREEGNYDQIYLYEEGGKWYAYEKSAYHLINLLDGKDIPLKRCIKARGIIWLISAQVEFLNLPLDHVISFGDTECILSYLPVSGYNEWVSQIHLQ